MSTTTMKGEAQRMLDLLPDDATLDDLLYQIYFRQSVEAGLQDVKDGRLVQVDEVRRRLGVSK